MTSLIVVLAISRRAWIQTDGRAQEARKAVRRRGIESLGMRLVGWLSVGLPMVERPIFHHTILLLGGICRDCYMGGKGTWHTDRRSHARTRNNIRNIHAIQEIRQTSRWAIRGECLEGGLAAISTDLIAAEGW